MTHVSVIIPTYNRKHYVKQAIDSVLQQTYTDREIIVIDDGSTDGTGRALRHRYGNQIHYHWQKNQGESIARNLGLRLAKGVYIGFLDSDDLWLPHKLQQQVPLLETRPQTVLTFSHARNIDAHGFRLDLGRSMIGAEDLSLPALCLKNSMWTAPSTALVRRAALEEIGGYDPSIRLGEDYNLFLRLRLRGRFAYQEDTLALRRLHAGRQMENRLLQSLQQRLAGRLKTLHNVFDHWPGSVSPNFRLRALANCFHFMSVLGYSSGQFDFAQRCLRHVLYLTPGQGPTGDAAAHHFALQITNALIERAVSDPSPFRSTAHRSAKVFANWPESLPLSHHRKAYLFSSVFLKLFLLRSITFSFRALDGDLLRKLNITSIIGRLNTQL